jgi:hypothetical protein
MSPSLCNFGLYTNNTDGLSVSHLVQLVLLSFLLYDQSPLVFDVLVSTLTC